MSFTLSEVITALDTFRTDAGRIPPRFHSDFNKKLIGGKALQWILVNNSNIIVVPAPEVISRRSKFTVLTNNQ